MKKITYILFLFFPTILFSQVSDKEWEHDKTRDIIIIKYNLNKIDKYNFYNIKVVGTVNGDKITINTLEGDVGKLIKVGPNKEIKWDVLADVKELKGELTLNVIAIPNPEGVDIPTPQKEKTNTTPLWIGLGGSVAAGGALIVVGVIKISDGKDMHQIYIDNRYEYDEVFEGQTRQEYYDEANSKYKTGIILTSVGAAVVAAGGIYFINKLLSTDKNNKVSFNISPLFNQQNRLNPTKQNGFIASVTLKF